MRVKWDETGDVEDHLLRRSIYLSFDHTQSTFHRIPDRTLPWSDPIITLTVMKCPAGQPEYNVITLQHALQKPTDHMMIIVDLIFINPNFIRLPSVIPFALFDFRSEITLITFTGPSNFSCCIECRRLKDFESRQFMLFILRICHFMGQPIEQRIIGVMMLNIIRLWNLLSPNQRRAFFLCVKSLRFLPAHPIHPNSVPF